MKFTNKNIIVTGGSRGIGKAAAIAFANEGGNVAITYNNNKRAADETLSQLKPPGKHTAIKCDAADPIETEKMINTVLSAYGRIDVVVINAGIAITHKIAEIDYNEWQSAWDKVLGVNLIGPANTLYLAARAMMKNGGGKIVTVSSRGAFRGEPDEPAYGASKAGLNSLSQSMARALAPYNISVGVVAPGWIETDLAEPYLNGPNGEEIKNQSPLKRAGTIEEVAGAILYLASDGSEYTTGAIIDVNGASYLRS